MATDPTLGSLVGCWFPYKEEPFKPGPDFRPAIVLQIIKRIDKKETYLLLCYATGQSEDCNKFDMSDTQFEVDPDRLNNINLTVRTRFDLSNVVALPLGQDFFAYPKNNGNYKSFGKLKGIYIEKTLECLSKSKVCMEFNPFPENVKTPSSKTNQPPRSTEIISKKKFNFNKEDK